MPIQVEILLFTPCCCKLIVTKPVCEVILVPAVEELYRNLTNTGELTLEELPDLDLYMDQVLTLFSRQGEEPLLTKTMINNYRKENIIRPLDGKRYTKNHIVQMLLIYHLKGILSLGEIAQVMEECYVSPGYDNALTRVYREFLEQKPLLDEAVKDCFDQFLPESALADSTDLLAALLGLSRVAQYADKMAKALVEAHFGPGKEGER